MVKQQADIGGQDFDEIFDIDHPVFAWIYRASHYWPAVIDLIPGFKAHLGATKDRKMSHPGLTNPVWDQMTLSKLEEVATFGTKFKELFCVAASDLADGIHEPLRDLGVLSESIMLTGTIEKPRKLKRFSWSMTPNRLSNAEYGQMHPNFGRGQLLFLVRQVTKREAAKLQGVGFIFANLTYIMPALAQSMEVTIGELSGKMHQIYRSLSDQPIMEPGVHIGCYALRPKFHGGWDILINKDKRNLLPSVRLSTDELETWQTGILTDLDNMTVHECYLYLQDRISHTHGVEEAFLSSVDRAVSSLAAQVDHPLLDSARFLARPYSVPCQSLPGSQQRPKATMMVFRVITDAHYGGPLNGRFEFGPARLFRAQQHVYPGSPDHGAFARQVHLEFAGMVEPRPGTIGGSSTTSGHSTPRNPSESSEVSSQVRTPVGGDNGKHSFPFSTGPKSLGKAGSGIKKPDRAYNGRPFFGGIHVQNEVSVDVTEVDQGQEFKQSIELGGLGVHNEVTVAPTEMDTFADELMLLLIEERRRQSVRTQPGRNV